MTWQFQRDLAILYNYSLLAEGKINIGAIKSRAEAKSHHTT
jgi:hypothetical protein